MSADRRADREHVTPPPPEVEPEPRIITLAPGTEILRIYLPSEHTLDEMTFRHYGPLLRFDHHSGSLEDPSLDPDRAIWYGAPLEQADEGITALEVCLWECFAQTRRVDPRCSLGRLQVNKRQELRLLSLIDAAAVEAGTIAQIAATPNPLLSQEWSRFFYENSGIYEAIDGLIYRSAWTGGFDIALYERGQKKIEPHPELGSLPVSHPALLPTVAEIALQRGWTIARATLPDETL